MQTSRTKTSATKPGNGKPGVDHERVADDLERILLELETAESVAITCCKALDALNVSETDDIEVTLRCHVTDVLTKQYDELEKCMLNLRGRPLDIDPPGAS